jgi:predicted RNA-binding Zn ribbon-like protein
MPDIDDIWDDEEDLSQFTCGDMPAPRLCRNLFESNADAFIAEIALKIANIKDVRSSTRVGGDYRHTIDRYILLLESAKIAATAQRDISISQDQR